MSSPGDAGMEPFGEGLELGFSSRMNEQEPEAVGFGHRSTEESVDAGVGESADRPGHAVAEDGAEAFQRSSVEIALRIEVAVEDHPRHAGL